MNTTDSIIRVVRKLEKKYGTNDPLELCEACGIHVLWHDLGKKLKGYYCYISRGKYIVVDCNLNDIILKVVLAHELGHVLLHTMFIKEDVFQGMGVFRSASPTEHEANLFAAELLLDDKEVLEELKYFSFFQAAKYLEVPAALLDYKLLSMRAKGVRIRTMEYRNSQFLKEDLGAYDEIW